MSNTIIVGDVAEGQKWFGEAEFLKQQLVNTYKNTNPNMSTWKQVTADVKIFVKMVNGIPQAFIYTEGGLFVTFWDTDTAPPINASSELYTGRLLYKDTLTPTKRNNYLVGGKGYWYSADGKESISWDTGVAYVKGVAYQTGNILHAAIKSNTVIILDNAVQYVNGTTVSTSFSLLTYTIKADGIITYVSTSYSPINISVVNAHDFEISKDLKTVTLIADTASDANGILYKIDILENYVLGELVKVLELPPVIETRVTVSSGGSPSNGSRTVTSTVEGVGTLVTGKIVGRQYHYIYTTAEGSGNSSVSSVNTIVPWDYTVFPAIPPSGSVSEVYNDTRSITDTIKIGIVDLYTLNNILDTDTVYSHTNSNGVSGHDSLVVGAYRWVEGYYSNNYYSLNITQSTMSSTYTVVAFYPEKKICVLKVAGYSGTTTDGMTSVFMRNSVSSYTNYSKLLIFRNNRAISGSEKTGLTAIEIQNLYTYSLQEEVYITGVTGGGPGNEYQRSPSDVPVGISFPTETSTDISTRTVPIDIDYDFSENSSILATKTIIDDKSSTIDKTVYQLIIDIDRNIVEARQSLASTIEGQKIIQNKMSVTT